MYSQLQKFVPNRKKLFHITLECMGRFEHSFILFTENRIPFMLQETVRKSIKRFQIYSGTNFGHWLYVAKCTRYIFFKIYQRYLYVTDIVWNFIFISTHFCLLLFHRFLKNVFRFEELHSLSRMDLATLLTHVYMKKVKDLGTVAAHEWGRGREKRYKTRKDRQQLCFKWWYGTGSRCEQLVFWGGWNRITD